MSTEYAPLYVSSPAYVRKVNLHGRLSKIVDMLAIIESLASMYGRDPDDDVKHIILDLEAEVYMKVMIGYNDLEPFIKKKAKKHTKRITHSMNADPQFLSPINISQEKRFRNKAYGWQPSLPLNIFLHNIYTQQLIPLASQLAIQQSFYHPRYYGGILKLYIAKSNNKRTDTNVLLHLIKCKNWPIVWSLQQKHSFNATSISRAKSLILLYHPSARTAFDYFVRIDPRILFYSIENQHPIHYLYSKAKNSGSTQNRMVIEWFGFIYHYLRLSIQHYPKEAGFIFNSTASSVPVIMELMTLEKVVFEETHLLEALYPAFDGLKDITGLYHQSLKHSPHTFLQFMYHIKQKGDYCYKDKKGESIMCCWLGSKSTVSDEFTIINLMFEILRTWPECVLKVKRQIKPCYE